MNDKNDFAHMMHLSHITAMDNWDDEGGRAIPLWKYIEVYKNIIQQIGIEPRSISPCGDGSIHIGYRQPTFIGACGDGRIHVEYDINKANFLFEYYNNDACDWSYTPANGETIYGCIDWSNPIKVEDCVRIFKEKMDV